MRFLIFLFGLSFASCAGFEEALKRGANCEVKLDGFKSYIVCDEADEVKKDVVDPKPSK